jgi:hypothetical protein
VSAGWVAGSVRARAIARRALGAQEARRLAACGSLSDALAMLATTPYQIGSDLGGGQQALAAAQHAVAASALWDLRVLAGWLPQGSAPLMRTLAGWFEIANVAERIHELAGRPPGEVFRLGALATVWPRSQQATSLAQLRAVLAASAWRDPGGDSAAAIEVGLRTRWAERVAALGAPARNWAAAALAIMLAGERFGPGQRPEQPVLRSVAVTLLGRAITDARSLDEFTRRLPRQLSSVFDGVRSPDQLWRAEAAWWAQTERDGHALAACTGFDRRPVIGAAAVLAADARLVRAALEVAARGGGAMGAFDAVA